MCVVYGTASTDVFGKDFRNTHPTSDRAAVLLDSAGIDTLLKIPQRQRSTIKDA